MATYRVLLSNGDEYEVEADTLVGAEFKALGKHDETFGFSPGVYVVTSERIGQ